MASDDIAMPSDDVATPPDDVVTPPEDPAAIKELAVSEEQDMDMDWEQIREPPAVSIKYRLGGKFRWVFIRYAEPPSEKIYLRKIDSRLLHYDVKTMKMCFQGLTTKIFRYTYTLL